MASRTTPTGRRPAASKPAAVKEKKPAAHFSLVQAEKEREEDEKRPEPFRVEIADGEFVTLRDPEDLGWQEAASLDIRNTFLTMQTILSEEDYQAFIKVDYKLPAVRDMLNSWKDHYGVETGN